MPNETPKLIRAEATKVLGEYDHLLEFAEEEDFVIIYGPNGVGKTKFLEIINALSRVDGRALSRLPFKDATLSYSDGTSVTAESTVESVGSERPRSRRALRFQLTHGGISLDPWDFTGGGFEDWLINNTPWRPYDDGEIWEDRRDGELSNIADLARQYPDGEDPNRAVPPAYRKFRNSTSSYLIETQRLRIEQNEPQRGWRPGARRRRSSKIVEHAAKMKSLVNDAQTEHSTITQQLDRTFPNRVLSWLPLAQDADTIRGRYEQQNEFRSRLGRVASVELAEAFSLPDRTLEDWELRLLDLYLDDTDTKLAPFVLLLKKIELLEAIVNSRLLSKRLQVTAKDGLSVLHEQDRREIDLDSLSSGEQHEIILMFDLLFNVPQGALVLIDEPEISLHVVWQLAFIPDVQRIAELSGFRFVVATHSPQIINDAWEKAVRLGPQEVPFT